MKIGVLPLARSTFDVEYAEEKLAAMLGALDRVGCDVVGPRALLLDESATQKAIVEMQSQHIDQILVLQVTFTDAAMTCAIAETLNAPLSIWAVKEPRMGGRLRLNALCGLNLASHALGLRRHRFSWLYADPIDGVVSALESLFAGARQAGMLVAKTAQATASGERIAHKLHGKRIAHKLRGKRIARIGAPPVGFDTCRYRPEDIEKVAGITVESLHLDALFDDARAVSAAEVALQRGEVEAIARGLDAVDQAALERSLKLRSALNTLKKRGGFDAFALRCWPETFTEYGGAICAPAAMMGEERTPCACEADVYGALTQLVLQEVADAPVFLTDLVDVDIDDDTAVVWHCGQAPASLRDPETDATATIHTNRKMPLLFEFPLKPGRVTVLRISQSFGALKMVLGAGEMLRRPQAFTGTSGVVQMDGGAKRFLGNVIDSGLEHHMALAYGDHRAVLRGVADALDLPILEF